MTSTSMTRRTGTGLVLAGLVTFVLSTVVDGGFVDGLFQGMTVALMVIAASLLGTQWRRDRRDAEGEDPETMWLPSHDERRP